MAAQQKLGLLSDRWSGAYPRDRSHPCPSGPVLSRGFNSIIGACHLKHFYIAAIVLVLPLLSGRAFAYSVPTHEEIVDLAWTTGIRPLLIERYPGLTGDRIKEAHAYAYGGSVIQDLGYYPFGSKEFSELTHYVRGGDFVLELLDESQNADEYAFALGALSHCVADIDGHPAVNEAVAIHYPKLRDNILDFYAGPAPPVTTAKELGL